MHNGLTVFDFNNNGIRFEDRSGVIWVSLTDMAHATGKRVNDWNRLSSTNLYIDALSESTGIPADQLLYSNESTGSNETRGTWAIKQVALKFAAWCSVDFEIWVYQQIDTLMSTGHVELPSRPQPYPTYPIESLPPADIRISNLINALQAIEFDITNPRFKQSLQDLTGDILGLTKTVQLLPAEEIWLGTSERAEQLGYAIALVTKYRSTLGKFVKSQGVEHRQEKRLCNGTQRTIHLYKLCDELDNAIRAYFNSRNR